MKAWRQHPTAGKHANRRAQKAAGRIDRNAWFKGGSKLLLALFARAGIRETTNTVSFIERVPHVV